MKPIFGWFIYLLLELGVNGNAVSFINPCKWDDSNCLMTSAQKALPFIAAGLPELGVPSADPLVLEDVNGDTGDLKLSFKGLKVEGLSKCQFTKLERDIKKSSVTMVLNCPYHATAKYVGSGKFFVLPVEGEGDFETKGGIVQISTTFNIQTITGSDGKKHWKIVNKEYSYDPIEKFNFVLSNLYNGDEEKAKPILQILDIQWKEVMMTVGKSTIDKVIQQLNDVIARFFDAVQIEELELA